MKRKIIFAGGCFWGLEAAFYDLKGVLETSVGYMGGVTENPTYQEVSKNTTGHAEVVKITFDDMLISLDDLLRIFFKSHNVSALSPRKEQYRSAIFTSFNSDYEYVVSYVEKLKKIRTINTQVESDGTFYLAEERHQKYYKKHKKSRG